MSRKGRTRGEPQEEEERRGRASVRGSTCTGKKPRREEEFRRREASPTRTRERLRESRRRVRGHNIPAIRSAVASRTREIGLREFEKRAVRPSGNPRRRGTGERGKRSVRPPR